MTIQSDSPMPVASAVEGVTYRQTLNTVMDWGLDRFEEFRGDAMIKRSKKQALSELEQNVLTCFATLHPVVKLHEEAQSLVFALDQPRFVRACPLPLAEGASKYALHEMRVVLWLRGGFVAVSLEEWLNHHCETHSLMLIGSSGAGKSKLLHMLAQELCLGGDRTQYVFTKAIDPLGVLSHAGMLKRCGVLACTDFSLKAGRNVQLDAEELKSVLDIVEGGTIPSTRYRSAVIEAGLPRVFAVNTGDSAGSYFSKHEQYGIAMLIETLPDVAKATEALRGMSDDDIASVRRVAICLPDPGKSLITESLLTRLEADTSAATGLRQQRRRAHWADRD